MAHANQERWASLVDAKLRNTLVTRDNLIFNSRYEGDPTSGKVKIPVRDTEVSVKEYNKATGVDAEVGTTTYLDLNIDHDEAVNELIDGYDAASVPDDIVADRLDSAGYSLALSVDKKSIDALEGAVGATISATKTAATETNAYKLALEAKRVLGRKGVPNEGRFLIASPEYLEVLMLDEHFIKQGDLSLAVSPVSTCSSPTIWITNPLLVWPARKPPRNLSPDTPTGVTASWSGRPRCTCRTCPAPASTSVHPLCRAARCTA